MGWGHTDDETAVGVGGKVQFIHSSFIFILTAWSLEEGRESQLEGVHVCGRDGIALGSNSSNKRRRPSVTGSWDCCCFSQHSESRQVASGHGSARSTGRNIIMGILGTAGEGQLLGCTHNTEFTRKDFSPLPGGQTAREFNVL